MSQYHVWPEFCLSDPLSERKSRDTVGLCCWEFCLCICTWEYQFLTNVPVRFLIFAGRLAKSKISLALCIKVDKSPFFWDGWLVLFACRCTFIWFGFPLEISKSVCQGSAVYISLISSWSYVVNAIKMLEKYLQFFCAMWPDGKCVIHITVKTWEVFVVHSLKPLFQNASCRSLL